MKIIIQFLLGSVLIVFSVCAPVLAGGPAPSQRLEIERRAFMENQIPAEHKLFLDSLGERFKDLVELNGAAARLFEATSSQAREPRNTDLILKKYSRQALSLLSGRANPAANVKQFSQNFFSVTDISAILDEIIDFYERCSNISQNIDTYSQRAGGTGGSYYYFGIRSNAFEKAFGENITQVLEKASRKYAQLYPVAKKHEIARLQAESEILSEYFKEAEFRLKTEVIEPLEVAHQTWMNAVLITVTKLVQQQYQLNYAFAESMKQVLADIPIPRLPQPADLTVPSIEIILPKNVKRGSRVKIMAQIKNIGELSSAPSQALVTLADGRKRVVRIPRLAANETHTISLYHTVRQYSENTFTVTANYNQKIPESRYDNNSTKRSLILPVE